MLFDLDPDVLAVVHHKGRLAAFGPAKGDDQVRYFDRVDIALPGGKTLTITKSPKAKPAKGTSVRFAGRKVTSYRFSHDALVNAGTIKWQ